MVFITIIFLNIKNKTNVKAVIFNMFNKKNDSIQSSYRIFPCAQTTTWDQQAEPLHNQTESNIMAIFIPNLAFLVSGSWWILRKEQKPFFFHIL